MGFTAGGAGSGSSFTRRGFLGHLGRLAGAACLVGAFGLAGCAHGDEANAYAEARAGVRELVELEVDTAGLRALDTSHVSPDPETVEGTVLTASVTPHERQRLFLWEEGRAPAVTEPSSGGYDPEGFRPTVTSVPVPEGTDVKGAVLLCAGGAFMVRGDNSDCYPTAEELARRGYQCFVVDYRLRPYTQAEGGIDLARAIRFVRAHAAEFGLPDERCIAVGGYSAGGILCGETLINWKGHTTPDELDPLYEPDELDEVSADAAADAMIYSFYGRLSVASRDEQTLYAADLPPTYYCYGTEDPFYDQFEMQVGLMASLGYTVHARVLNGWPHGFGALGGWIPEFDEFMQEAFAQARA